MHCFLFSGIIYFNKYKFQLLNISIIETIIGGAAKMSIPEKFRETRDALLGDLMRSEKDLSRSSLMFRSVIANAFGLNVTDAECLDYLMDFGPATAGKLAELTGLTNGAITNVIDRLEKAGFVTRQSDLKDRRKVMVVIVQEKINAVAEIYRPTVMKIYGLYAGYSDEELEFLLGFYQDMLRIYQEGIDHDPHG
jgi:MarR family transcriptional regulator, organic hydroperoxide resistance regulator